MTSSTHTLLACPGWGSAIVEALFALTPLPLKIEDLDPIRVAADRERLAKFNPLVQIPTLILPDGTVMTESGAIALHVADMAPGSGLVPHAGDPSRPMFLRWLVFIVANIYATYYASDDPSRLISGEAAQKELKQRSDAYRERLWRIVEEAVTPKPWFLGERFSALDVFVGVVTRWSPRRDWFKANAPKLFAIAQAVDAEPRLAGVWRRNFA